MISTTQSLRPEVRDSLHEWVNATRCVINSGVRRGQVIQAMDVLAELMSGTLLCHIFNRLRHGSIQRVHENPSLYGQMDNITQFVEALSEHGIEATFNPRDIVMGTSIAEFVHAITVFATFAKQHDPTMPTPPLISTSGPGIFSSSHDLINNYPESGLSATNVTILMRRISSLEEQQERLVNVVLSMEQATLQTQRTMDRLATGLLDVFTEIRSLRSSFNTGSESSESIHSVSNLAQAAESFPSGTTLYVNNASIEHRQSQDLPIIPSFSSQFILQPPDVYGVPGLMMKSNSTLKLEANVVSPLSPQPVHSEAEASPSNPNREKTQVTLLDEVIFDHSPDRSTVKGAAPLLPMHLTPVSGTRSKLVQDMIESASMCTIEQTSPTTGKRDSDEIMALKKQLYSRLSVGVLNGCSTRIELMQQSAIYELIETERLFVRDLSVILEVVKPWLELRLKSFTGSMSNLSNIDKFFGNIDVISQSHIKILDIMNRQIDTYVVIESMEEIVNGMIPLLKHHVEYATHYSTDVAPVLQQPDFIPISNEVGLLPETNKQTLASLLIKPIQRIAKYPLLLTEIKKHSFENHPGYRILESGIHNLYHLLEQVNANSAPPSQGFNSQMATFSKTVTGFDDISLPQDSEFLREGAALRWMNGKMSKVHWILFVDALVVCKVATARSARKKYDIVQVLNPAKLIVLPVPAISGHPNTCAIDIFPIGDDHQGLPDSISSISAAVEWVSYTASGTDKTHVTSCTFAFEVSEERSAWIRALDKAMGLQIKRGSKTLFKRKNKGRRPWSFLSEPKDSLKGSESGPNFSAYSGLPASTISPHDLPDNMELLVRTTDRHSPTSRYEVGFAKNTFLRVVNCEKDLWKISMGRVVGLVSKSLVARVDVEPCRYTQLLQACQTEKVSAWIDCPGDCVISMRPTAIAKVMRSSSSVGDRMNMLVSLIAPTSQGQKLKSIGVPNPIPLVTRFRKASAPSASIKKHKPSKRDSSKGAKLITKVNPNVTEMKSKRGVVMDPVKGREGWVKITRDNTQAYYYHRLTGQTLWSLPEPEEIC